MKTNSSKAADPKPMQRVTHPKSAENKSPADAVSLSPEEMKNRASTTTKVLSEILRHEKTFYSRHYGINE